MLGVSLDHRSGMISSSVSLGPRSARLKDILRQIVSTAGDRQTKGRRITADVAETRQKEAPRWIMQKTADGIRRGHSDG